MSLKDIFQHFDQWNCYPQFALADSSTMLDLSVKMLLEPSLFFSIMGGNLLVVRGLDPPPITVGGHYGVDFIKAMELSALLYQYR